MKTIALVPPPSRTSQVKADVIQMLSDALKRAEEGEIAEAILIFRSHDNWWQYHNSLIEDFSRAIGQLEIIKQELIEGYIKHHFEKSEK